MINHHTNLRKHRFYFFKLWLFIGSLFLLVSGKFFKVKTFKILSLYPTQVWLCWPWEIYLLEGIYLEMASSKLNLSLFCSSQSSNNLLGIWLWVMVLWVSSGIRICKRTKHRYGVVIACLQTRSSAGKTRRNEFKAILGFISRLFFRPSDANKDMVDLSEGATVWWNYCQMQCVTEIWTKYK